MNIAGVFYSSTIKIDTAWYFCMVNSESCDNMIILVQNVWITQEERTINMLDDLLF